MSFETEIVSVYGRQIFSERGHPGIEAVVETANGGKGIAVCTAGISIGVHEVPFVYDGGDRWGGKGVEKAVERISSIVAPNLIGLDATRQLLVDDALLSIDGPDAKARLGGNVTAAVSAAVLKAGAAALGIPLYQHIGGVNACVLPTPGVLCLVGSHRYGGTPASGGKPSYSFFCHGFATFSEASYAAWDVYTRWERLLSTTFDLESLFRNYPTVPPGKVKHDRDLWDLMVKVIDQAGYAGKIGIQVDVAAATYWRKDLGKFVGLFSAEPKTRDELIEMYHWMTREYPFVIIEDPLDEEDYEGHAILARELSIEIVGDDLFTTSTERLQHGIDLGAANTILLKVNQIGTISEAFDTVRLAYRHGYGVMPCSSRGEGEDIADYSVGLSTGHQREGATGPTGNRLLQIEAELGSRAVLIGLKGLKVRQ